MIELLYNEEKVKGQPGRLMVTWKLLHTCDGCGFKEKRALKRVVEKGNRVKVTLMSPIFFEGGGSYKETCCVDCAEDELFEVRRFEFTVVRIQDGATYLYRELAKAFATKNILLREDEEPGEVCTCWRAA